MGGIDDQVAFWVIGTFCIGFGFILLGFRNLLAGAATWTVVLRGIIALGFIILGAASLGTAKPKSGSDRRERQD
jgi:hypothetical protein